MSIHRYCRANLRALIIAGTPPQWLVEHKRHAYIRRAVLAAPPWIKERDFWQLVKQRDDLTRTTGIKHVLAHIIPLSHHLVSGLNVPWNIKVITEHENYAESNYWHDTPETAFQHRLFA